MSDELAKGKQVLRVIVLTTSIVLGIVYIAVRAGVIPVTDPSTGQQFEGIRETISGSKSDGGF